MRSFLLIFALILLQPACAQSKKSFKEFEKARQALREDEVEKALNHLEKVNKKDPDFVDAWILRADIHRGNEDYNKAISFYKSALKTGKADFVLFNLGETSFINQQYDEAKRYMQSYLQLRRSAARANDLAQRIIISSEFAAEAIKTPFPFSPENLGENINDEGHQYFPSISADGEVLVFTERQIKGPKRDEDFFESIKLNDGEWAPKERLKGRLNTDNNEGAQSLSADGKTLFFAGCQRPDGYGSCDIYIAFRDAKGMWSQPQNLGQSINTAAWESMPSISPDGKTLYFVRGKDMRASKMTIMFSEKQADGSWSVAKPIPGEVNTPHRETTPFIYFDNTRLYFASDGHPGFGDLDFFVSERRDDGTWGKPENLGYPINTHREESSLVLSPDGKTGFFASEREEGFGGLDLYKFDVPPPHRGNPVAFVEGVVRDAKTKKVIPNALLEVIDINKNDTVWTLNSDESGGFFIILPAQRDYALSVEKENYLFHSENFSLEEEGADAPRKLLVDLNKLEKGESVVLRNIFFDYDKFELKNTSFTELNRVVQLLKRSPNLSVEIAGHTDNQGSDAYNQKLSENRAQSVKDYLIEKGIAAKNVSIKGYGASSPIATNETEEGRAINRRIEMVVK
ncbi:MAG: OmpA family protein [Cryomorphaceae bacterium]|nr:OmpA family protein [Cryomorphaceae bacterium]